MNNSRDYKLKNRGAALLIFIILFLIASTLLVGGIGRGVYQDILRYRALEMSKGSFFGVEAGIEDAIYRHINVMDYAPVETFNFNGTSVSVTRSIVSPEFEFFVTADKSNRIRKGYLKLVLGNGASFGYGLQADTGGIEMLNSSSVIGNIYSNGSVIGANDNAVSGTIVVGGPTGYVSGVHTGGSIFAHTIDDSISDTDAFCDTISGSTIAGDLFCDNITATTWGGVTGAGPADQPLTVLPISDADIDDIKADAEAGGIIASTDPLCSSGTYTIDTDTTIGPVKIECDLFVDKNSTDLTLAGQVWVEGSVTTKSSPNFHVDASLPGKSIAIVVDNPADRLTDSKVVFQNSASFAGAGANSYILLISMNNDEEVGAGTEIAIESSQSATGDVLLYAPHGLVDISQSGGYIGISALQIDLHNSAQITYETGAISLQFPDGPSGGFLLADWYETE